MKVKILILTIATLAFLSSCIKDSDDLNSSGEKSMITIKMIPPSEDTRAVATPVANNSSLVFNNGYLIFVDNGGSITQIFEVVDGAGTSTLISINDLVSATGATITDVYKVAKKIYFLGNVASDFVLPALNTSIDPVLDQIRTIESSYDGLGGVGKVGIYGLGEITKSGTRNVCVFDIKAVMARLEILSLEIDAVNLDNFDVEAIFLNYFYSNSDYRFNSSDIIKYTSMDNFSENGMPYFATSYKGITFDYDENYLGGFTGSLYRPVDASKVWAYNVFPNTNRRDIPHIIIKLANVRASNDFILNYGSDPFIEREYWYATIKRYSLPNIGFLVEQFMAGYVYRMSEILITPNTLYPYPEPDEGIEVKVKASVIPWIDVDMEVDLPQFPW